MVKRVITEADKDKKKDPPTQTIEVPMPSETSQPQNISLDQIVDKYFIQYEREAIPQQPGIQQEALASFMKFLFEADEADPADAGEDTGDLGGGGDLDTTGTDSPTGAPAPPDTAPPTPQPVLNIKTFATKLARLVVNYNTLLNPKVTILNRANAYIARNYGDNTAKELMITLDLTFGLSPRSGETQKDTPPAPFAVGATVGDTAGGGTGGT